MITATEGMLNMTSHSGSISRISNTTTQMFPSRLYREKSRRQGQLKDIDHVAVGNGKEVLTRR